MHHGSKGTEKGRQGKEADNPEEKRDIKQLALKRNPFQPGGEEESAFQSEEHSEEEYLGASGQNQGGDGPRAGSQGSTDPYLSPSEGHRIGQNREKPVGGQSEGKKTKNQCDDGKPLQGGQRLGKVAGKRTGFLGDCPPSVTLGLFSYAAKEITGTRFEIQEYVGPIRRMLARGEEDCSRRRV